MDIGSQIGPYRIDSLLGRGGMAEVYKAWHSGLQRWEALKVLPPEMTVDRSFVERFLQEACTAANLQHRHIAAIHSVSDASGPQYYFAMELIEGGNLADLLQQRIRLPLEEATAILRQVAEALDYAHSRGVIHRDVKPANALLGADGQRGWNIKVVDFGIARAQEGPGAARLTRTGIVIGTPEYMSPEQAGSGAPVDHRSDIYSLGVVAYEMLCGQPPFRAATDTSPLSILMAHVRDLPRPPIEINPGLPPAVNYALLKALAKDPRERFYSCADFVDALTGAVMVAPPAPMHNPLRTQSVSVATAVAPRPSYTIPLLVSFAVIIGMSLLGFGIYSSVKTASGSGSGGGISSASGSTNGSSSSTGSGATTGTSSSTGSTGISTSGKTKLETVTVPDVHGVSEDQARQILTSEGLRTDGATGYSDITPRGHVIRQNPSAGQTAKREDVVTIRISLGPRHVTPPPVHSLDDSSAGSSTTSTSGTTDSTTGGFDASTSEIRSRYYDWLRAWQNRDINSFMSFYSPGVVVERTGKPSYGYAALQSRMQDSWAKQSYITINSAEPSIEVNGDTATLRAYEDFDSTTWRDAGQKILQWTRSGRTWQICDESFNQESGSKK